MATTLCNRWLFAIALVGMSVTTGASAQDTLGRDSIRDVAARLDTAYLDRGMPGLMADEKRCYAAAGNRSAALKVCMLYDMSVHCLDAGVKSYFDIRGGVSPDVALPYHSDPAFGARMKLDTYYAFHGSVEAATAYFGDGVNDVLQAVADRRQQLDRIEQAAQPVSDLTSQPLGSGPASTPVAATRRPPSARVHAKPFAVASAASRK